MSTWRVALLAVSLCLLANAGAAFTGVTQKNSTEKADFSRLPVFYTSDKAYDEFVNEWFMRHLSVDERGVYYGSGVCLGMVDHMWVVDWDAWMLPWIDRGAMGRARQGGSDRDSVLTTVRDCVVDKYGYVFGGQLWAEPNNALGGYRAVFAWPWPKYNRNALDKVPSGWEFNDINDGFRDRWRVHDIELAPGYVDCRLEGKITGPHPELVSPKFDTDVFQVPIVELDIAFRGEPRKRLDGLIDKLKLYWTTDKSPRFSEERMVTIDFCDLPPKDFTDDYVQTVTDKEARYPLYFQMYLHPEWGTEGRRITRLKIVPTGEGAEGVTVSLNYARASYDVRLATSNATLINSVYKFYIWSGDTEFLQAMMPKLRKAILFLNEHMKGRKEALICTDWMPGKDGRGGDYIGHGQIVGGYWDLMPSGRYDINSSSYYYYALRAMAEMERVVRSRNSLGRDLKSRPSELLSPVEVLGPDNKTMILYRDTPESLDKLADRVKAKMEKVFWDPAKQRFVRNIDIDGKKYDYGFLHHNLELLLFGIGTDAQRKAILSWVNGSRTIEGDTSTGADIYHWRFGPRYSTAQNETYFFWPWVHDKDKHPESAKNYVFGEQFQNGGASPFTGLFDLMARCSTGDQAEIDKAYERTLDIRKWFDDVRAAGGNGLEFYRKYYDGHPERGAQQSPNPGGLGLDHEFLSDASLGTEFLFYAFLGIDTVHDGVIQVAPKIPTQLGKIGVTNVFFRGNYLTIEAGRSYVTFEGSKITNSDDLKARVTLRDVPKGAVVLVDGKPYRAIERGPGGTVTVTVDLRPVKIEVKA